MMGDSHEASTLAVWFTAVGVAQHVGLHPQIIPTTAGAFLAYSVCRLPDVDNPDSRPGKAFPRTSRFLDRTTGHRGVTHWALTALVVGVATGTVPVLVTPTMWWIGASIGGSWLLHILFDCLTWEGVAMLRPFSRTRIRPRYGHRFECGGKFERKLLLPTMIVIAVGAAALDVAAFAGLTPHL
jgi:membrane-bound metal-dependent hydrolase YbcI (DUF457 family)